MSVRRLIRELTTGAPPAVRPRARGWIHVFSAPVAAAAGTALAVSAGTSASPGAAYACAIYTVTAVALFTVSATYHRRQWRSERNRALMKRWDHAMIFLFIAGTYTPVASLTLPPAPAARVLLVVWVAALTGAVLKLTWGQFPRWLGVPIYLCLGWVAVFNIADIHNVGGAAPVVLLCAGGLLYTAGTVMFSTRRPNPWPGVFGFHELFHACVSLAAATHCAAIWVLLRHQNPCC